MKFDKHINSIRTALTFPLPGETAQYLMAPKERKSKIEYLSQNKEPRLSSVLILFYPNEKGELHTLFIQRPINESVHSGQIAFPGGKLDDEDADLSTTALRETHEEIGIAPENIEIIGSLTNLFIPASNFLVHPFVGKIDFTPVFIPNPDEVMAVLPASLVELLSFKTEQQFFNTSYGNLMAPYFKFNEYPIWGATAMIVSELKEVIKKVL